MEDLKQMKYKAVIFDMDGTVLDTTVDLRNALNHALKANGHQSEYTVDHIKFFFGSGIEVAVKRALAVQNGMNYDELEVIGTPKDNLSFDKKEVSKVQKEFKKYYLKHCADNTGPYAGILELLEELKKRGLQCAVVSNKPHDAVVKLSEDYFRGAFEYVIGETETIKRKPAPDMLLKIVKDLNIKKEEVLYVGDSEIDILCAKNSGIKCLAVTWGFRSKKFLTEHHPDYVIDRPEDLLEVIC